jgi:hypothetical protein
MKRLDFLNDRERVPYTVVDEQKFYKETQEHGIMVWEKYPHDKWGYVLFGFAVVNTLYVTGLGMWEMFYHVNKRQG